MTVPEWVVIVVLSSIGVIFWWGVLRLIKSQDDTSSSLVSINTNLSAINGRLGKSETWMEQHEKQDDSRYEEVKQQHESMWAAIDNLRRT